jgi:hypothetical protein
MTLPHVLSPADALHTHAPASRRALWMGRVLTGVGALFLLMDAVGKLLRLPPVVSATTELGYPADAVFTLGVLEALCLALSLWGPTAAVGTVLLTGYLGGAVATHVRLGNPLLSHTLFPVYVGVMVWAGLCLRETRLRDALLPRRGR